MENECNLPDPNTYKGDYYYVSIVEPISKVVLGRVPVSSKVKMKIFRKVEWADSRTGRRWFEWEEIK